MEFTLKRTNFEIKIHAPKVKTYFYKISNTTNNKSYVGRTNNVIRRFDEHLHASGSLSLLDSIIDYGIKSFTFEILDTSSSEDKELLDMIEDYYIKKHDALNGFNKRLNCPIVKNEDTIPDIIQIKAKYICRDEDRHLFTVGECSNAKHYQVLTNIKEDNSSSIIKKTMNDYNYYQLEINADEKFKTNQMYDLQLKYEDYKLNINPPN